MTKAEQKQIDRATTHGRGALLRTMAQLHRTGSSRTQKAVELAISQGDAWAEFTRLGGALLHKSEV